jgi:hypothetical protein
MWIMNTKECTCCKKDLPFDWVDGDKFFLYRATPRRKEWLSSFCRDCNDIRLRWRREYQHPFILETWGITTTQLIALPKETRMEYLRIAMDSVPPPDYTGLSEGAAPPIKEKMDIAPFTYPQEHKDRLERDGSTVELAIKARKENKKDGFPYILEHPYYPGIRKLGYSYNPRSRLSTYNVGCPYKLFSMPYIAVYLEDAALAEATVQETLKEYHVSGEWYKVSRELAVKTIEDYVETLNDRKEQAMG